MKKSTSSGYIGRGRQHADQTCLRYLGHHPAAPGTAVARSLVFQAMEGEKTLADVLANPRRRIDSVRDPAELAHGSLAASNSDRAAINLMVGSPEDIGATELLRRRRQGHPNEVVHVTTFELTPTRKAYERFGDDAVLRIFDQRDNQEMCGVRRLYSECKRSDSPVWSLLDKNREREHVAVVFIPGPRDEPTANAIGWAHWLAALHEAGLIDARRRKNRLRASDLNLPAEFFKPISGLERLRRFNARLVDYVGVIEDTFATLKRILKILLVSVAVFGGVVGALHADVLQDQARQVLEMIMRQR